jgi:hypothetical protein
VIYTAVGEDVAPPVGAPRLANVVPDHFTPSADVLKYTLPSEPVTNILRFAPVVDNNAGEYFTVTDV